MPEVNVRGLAGRAARRVPGLRRLMALRDRYRGIEAEYHRVAGEYRQVSAKQSEIMRRIHFPPGHFYSPQPDPGEYAACPDPIGGQVPEPAALLGLDLNEVEQLATLQSLKPFYDEQPFQLHPAPGLRYHFANIYFSFADALSLYGLMRLNRPRQVVEVGSGYSSCVMLDTNEYFLGGECRLTFVEPYPDGRLLGLTTDADRPRFELIRDRVQTLDPAVFERLGPGDMLFIDSSHVAKAGSDVNYLVFEVLPRLATGVLVHFHDVFYPFEYPRVWLDEGRAWNESYLIRAFLMFNPAFKVVLFNRYLACFHQGYLAEAMPLYLRDEGGSLWLRRV
jgi:hypothetical protein